MKNKKKGSTLVMVLFLSTLFTMISGVVITSIITTTKSNASEEFYEDLLYGAEAGIETALMRIEKGIFSRHTPVKQVATYSHDDDFKEFTVNVGIKKTTTTEYEVISTAIDRKDNNRSRTVKAKVMEEEITGGVGEGTNIYKYVLCAERIYVTATGALDESVSKWSAEDKINSVAMAWTKPQLGKPTTSYRDSIVQNPMDMPIFDESKVGSRKAEIEISGAGDNGAQLNVIQEFERLSNIVNSGVKKFNFRTTRSNDLCVYLVNAERLIIEMGSMVLGSTVIITNGDIIFKKSGVGLEPSIHLSSSTIFGKELIFDLSSFTSDYRLIDNPIEDNETIRDAMTLDDVKRLDDEIRIYAPNWRSQTRRARVTSYEY